ncbi:MAG: hypothetical protein AAFR74_06495 [Pseudomonadota bacterium]
MAANSSNALAPARAFQQIPIETTRQECLTDMTTPVCKSTIGAMIQQAEAT